MTSRIFITILLVIFLCSCNNEKGGISTTKLSNNEIILKLIGTWETIEGGNDQYISFEKSDGDIQLQATVYEKESGRLMEVYTDQPAVQFYVGNYLDGSNIGKGNLPYHHRTGFCLETEHYPDSPNQSQFPSTVLESDEVYSTTTIYRFTTK